MPGPDPEHHTATDDINRAEEQPKLRRTSEIAYARAQDRCNIRQNQPLHRRCFTCLNHHIPPRCLDYRIKKLPMPCFGSIRVTLLNVVPLF
jgi:hypothetical protein